MRKKNILSANDKKNCLKSPIFWKEREDDYHAKGIIHIMLILQEISKWRKELYINVGNINPDI